MHVDLIFLVSINRANYKLDNASEKYKLPLLHFAYVSINLDSDLQPSRNNTYPNLLEFRGKNPNQPSRCHFENWNEMFAVFSAKNEGVGGEGRHRLPRNGHIPINP